MNYCVVTTINNPTKAIEELHLRFDSNLIVVTDEKTPENWVYKNTVIVGSVEKKYAPTNHYARKNTGYLQAIKNKATLIYDTDDDNIPNYRWNIRSENVEAEKASGLGWFNVYKFFTVIKIWPRGFSLKNINNNPEISTEINTSSSSIQQGLSNGEPDVDAIWRLVMQNGAHSFTHKKSIQLNDKTWCPFNSQSTWWFPKAYPLMYLPITATFRMTDIWRSFVAQRCLREIGEYVTFHSPSEVFQDRNEHDLLKDFKDEVPGYLKNDLIVDILEFLKLKPGEENMCHNLYTCYYELVDKGILAFEELESVQQWIEDYENIN